MTYPGLGGQQQPPYNAPAGQAPQPGVTPGVPPVLRVTEIIITPGGTIEGIFTYSTRPPAAGTLIESSSVATAGVDAFGNHFVTGHASYAGNFATSLNAGFIQFYTGSLAGGWTATGSIEADTLGDIAILAAGGRSVITLNNTLDDGSGNATIAANLTVSTINGSSNTGTGLPAGVPTGGPNGGVFAGHTHDFDGHTHPL